MNVTLSLNGSPAPSVFTVGVSYQLDVLIDGRTPVYTEWSLGLRQGTRTLGRGRVPFSPQSNEPHYLHTVAYDVDGTVAEKIFILSTAEPGAAPVQVSIVWKDPAPRSAGPNTATIAVSGITPARAISWVHYFNGAVFAHGEGATAELGHLQPGVHRLVATAIDYGGRAIAGDSSICVPAEFGLQAAVVPPQPTSTSLVYTGSVYSPVIEGNACLATALPFLLTSFISSVRLLPGTTHFSAELDPELNLVDDEVVVRTQLGNWTLKGPPTGLSSETLPYDYQHGNPLQPAPIDLSARYGVEVWNVHGLDVGAFKFRVRFRCFREGDPIYRYTPCPWSNYAGGAGERQRRLVAVFTKVDLSLDDETPQNRWGSRSVETFTTPNSALLRGKFDTYGTPDRPRFDDNRFFTAQNLLSFYESTTGLKDLPVHAVYGLPSVRAGVLDFSQPGDPRIVCKPKRLWGKLVLYLAGGALTSATTVTVRVYTGKAPGYVDVPVTISQTRYNPNYDVFVKAGEVDVDIEDFEFSRLGVNMDFTVNESNATGTTPASAPLMAVGEELYYARINAPAIKVDSACFNDPVHQVTFEGTFLGSAVPLEDCNLLACGPIGSYCYTQLGGSSPIKVLQPLGFPAPFVALYGTEATCYANPVFLSEYTGGATDAAHRVQGYSGTSGCGVAYRYAPCFEPHKRELAVVFPVNTVPHPGVVYQESCYGLVGAIQSAGSFAVVPAVDVSPVTGCTDVICTGSNPNGGSVDYVDTETLRRVSVSFPHMADLGVPFCAVVPEAFNQGYGGTPPGRVDYTLWDTASIPVMTATENAELEFTVAPPNIWRELLVSRAGSRQHYRFYPGLAAARISLQAGDVVTLEIGSKLRQYQGTTGYVSWLKPVALPYLYDTGTLAFVPTAGTLAALGFCGLSGRQDYSFFGTLGRTYEMSLCNPDTIVTVKDNSALPEMVVLRTKAPNDIDSSFLPFYQAQRLQSPLVFKFYANRAAGAHGEMDVWLTSAGTHFEPALPAFFKVSAFKALSRLGDGSRRNTRQSDTSRRGLRVVTEQVASACVSPGVYVDARGRRISVAVPSPTPEVDENGQTYTFTGTYDKGISEAIYRP